MSTVQRAESLKKGMQVREANQMVEEMMLLANCTVAERILSSFSACALLRRHPVPPPRQFEPLLRAAAACGFQLDVSSSKVCPMLSSAAHRDQPRGSLRMTGHSDNSSGSQPSICAQRKWVSAPGSPHRGLQALRAGIVAVFRQTEAAALFIMHSDIYFTTNQAI